MNAFDRFWQWADKPPESLPKVTSAGAVAEGGMGLDGPDHPWRGQRGGRRRLRVVGPAREPGALSRQAARAVN